MLSWVSFRSAFMRHPDRPSTSGLNPPNVSKPSATHLAEERLGSSISKWLTATEELEFVISEANARVRQRLVELQASIILAQDNLSPDNTAAQLALKRIIESAEKYHQVAHQFKGIVEHVVCVAALVRLLTKILDTLRLREPASILELPLQATNAVSAQERSWVAVQLAQLKLEVEQMDSRPNAVSGQRVTACVATLGAVFIRLSQQASDISGEICLLAAVIDKFDQDLAFAQLIAPAR